MYLSVVIPVYNESANLDHLCSRLLPVLDALGKSYEVIMTNDGSRDDSQAILNRLHAARPDVIKVIQFARNYGQHPAIMAGFQLSKGDVVVTMDADLQNPPEEIPKLLALIDAGHDVVGGYRGTRLDSAYRKFVSKMSNIVRAKITRIEMKDQGCMLRAYRRNIIDLILESDESTPFITVLAQYFANNPTEVEVAHEERHGGVSNYNLYKLIRYNFDLMTGFSLVPLQLFTILGIVLSGMSGMLVIVLALRRIFIGPESQGVFTLFGILFLLVGVAITGLGLIGEYVGRIYLEVRKRPRYVIRKVLGQDNQ
ncbi:MAG TPA: glycosyltransferase [Rickettsiales bacterium]|nr:glycosyltransferase [Rickettsiales bacterium]